MKSICDFDSCIGCNACFNICPTKAINMRDTNCQGYHPLINQKLCIDCNMCKAVCPSLRVPTFNEAISIYAAWSKDQTDRSSSTSGGLASVFYKKIVKDGGAACGCVLDEGLSVYHKVVTTEEELYIFKKSKYVQSAIGNTYSEIKQILDSKKSVLFIGTPCQVYGLKSYLGKEYEHLFVIDLVCHGVPPHSIFKKCLSVYDVSKISKLSFRSETDYELTCFDKQGNKLPYKNYYTFAFLHNISLCKKCYDCNYTKTSRVGDITLGDFGGLLKRTSLSIRLVRVYH